MRLRAKWLQARDATHRWIPQHKKSHMLRGRKWPTDELAGEAAISLQAELPRDAHAADDTDDLAAAIAFQEGTPRHQCEVLVTLDHSELAASQRDRAPVGAPDEVAIARRKVRHTVSTLGGEILTGTVDFAALQGSQQVWLVLDVAVPTPLGQPDREQLLLALLQGLLDLETEAHRRHLDPMPADQLAVQPGGGLGRNLAVERNGRMYLDAKLAALALLIGAGPRQEVWRNDPMVVVEAGDKARPAQRLQAPDVGLDVPLHITGGNTRSHPSDVVVLRGLVEPIIAGSVDGYGLVHRSSRGLPAEGQNGADARLFRDECCLQLHVMSTSIDAIDHKVGLVAQAVAGETFTDEMPRDGRPRQVAVD